MAGRLQGKTAIVTSAGQGIGRAAAICMAREGARVWATDINAEALSSLAQEQGESFLCTVVGLEYLLARDRGEPGAAASARGGDAGDRVRDDRDDDDREEGADDETLGEDFLEQQGFDRRTGE